MDKKQREEIKKQSLELLKTGNYPYLTEECLHQESRQFILRSVMIMTKKDIGFAMKILNETAKKGLKRLQDLDFDKPHIREALYYPAK